MEAIKKHRLAFIDLETTGLLPSKHEIIEIGAIIADQTLDANGKIKLEVVEEFEVKVKPTHIENADPEGLAINGYKEEDWNEAIVLKTALEILAQKVIGATMVGHNVSFDYAFLENAFESEGIKNTMHYRKLDTISIAFAMLYTERDVEKLSLRALCEYFNVENIKAHSALSDVRATMEVYKKLLDIK